METDLLTTCCCTDEPTFEDPFGDPFVDPDVGEYEDPYVDPYVTDDWTGELAPVPAPEPAPVPAPADPIVVAAPAPAIVLDPGPFGDGSGYFTGEVGGAYSTTSDDFDSWRSFGMPESGVPHPAFVAAQAAVPVIKTPEAWGIGPGTTYTFPGSTGAFAAPSQSIADIQNANIVTLQQLGMAHRTGQQAHNANLAALFGR
jgi:hypothetical protein